MAGKRVGEHPRNTGPMMASARCGAKTRSRAPCPSSAVQGKERCRMHGGAKGSGAPPGNRNALKHGLYTCEAVAGRREFNQMLREMRAGLREFEGKA